jgi:hypothetical protein
MVVDNEDSPPIARSTTGSNVGNTAITPTLKVGINYPYKDYGYDFDSPAGEHPQSWWNEVESDLTRFKDLGLFAVRWFILGDGRNYGPGDNRSGNVDPDWTPQVVPLTPGFKRDFFKLLQLFSDVGMKIMPVLMANSWCWSAEHTQGPNQSQLIKGGRDSLVSDPSDFFRLWLQPLLQESKRDPNRSVIYAWDIMNEPEFVLDQEVEGGPEGPIPVVDEDELKAFLRGGVDLVNTAEFVSTVGFRKRETISNWNDLHVRLHQFHYYPKGLLFGRGDPLPRHTFSQRGQCILGEIATRVDLLPAWPDHPGWVDRPPDNTRIYNRLSLIERLGYPAVFLYAANPADPDAWYWTRWYRGEHVAESWPGTRVSQSFPSIRVYPLGDGSVEAQVRRFTHRY